MLMKPPATQRGLSLIELMVTVTILAVILVMSAPSFSAWIQNSRLRGAAESVLGGLQFARAEAVSRNALVRFQLTSTLDATCALVDNSSNWIVNLVNSTAPPSDVVTALCNAPANDWVSPTDAGAVAPFIIRKHDGINGPAGLVVNGNTVTSITFNGLGRPTTAPMTVNFSNPTAGACLQDGGPVTCLRVVVSAAGLIRMCNPNFPAGDPQGC